MIELLVANSQNLEYFCKSCKQLRLGSNPILKCGNCGSKSLVISKPGTLNKEELLTNLEVKNAME